MNEGHSTQDAPALPGLAAGVQPTILLLGVSKWFGDIVAVSDVSFGVAAGATGLLGPNGAGKSTLLKMMAGLLKPSSGTVRINDHATRGKNTVYHQFGLVHESETVYPFLTGREFVRLNATLQGMRDVDRSTAWALDLVEMGGAADRKIGGYSKGMRQRIKVAGALVHNPEVLLMDEPLSGMDPAQRAHMIDLIRELGETKTVVVSSHVLAEVERFAANILVIINGKLAAAGDYRVIRDKMDEHDHTIRIRTDKARTLAAYLVYQPATRSVKVAGEDLILAETSDARAFAAALPALAKHANARILEVQPTDESLQSVFAYLVRR
ncbi:MAG: ABC transporter ATP-binding protein [Thermoleophilia bacterium]